MGADTFHPFKSGTAKVYLKNGDIIDNATIYYGFAMPQGYQSLEVPKDFNSVTIIGLPIEVADRSGRLTISKSAWDSMPIGGSNVTYAYRYQNQSSSFFKIDNEHVAFYAQNCIGVLAFY